ncbi:hypothetical protein HSBGL_2974 [Halapricum desulfuricans]|uniref:Uncharacterized protein n=1 Tax=Halapricum desulfuricans TaxID=2841257 RepID=A0A897NL18_9EURY|nr:hypothetical protein HSBGL_2974 [Halapricum desulfuricans]
MSTPRPTATPEPTSRPTATPEQTPRSTPTVEPTTTPSDLEPVLVEPEPRTVILQPVDDGPARYRVHNFRLYVVSANDGAFNGPNTEELFGDIFVRGYDGRDGSRVLAEGFDYRSGLVFTLNEAEARELAEGEYATQLDLDVVVSFPEKRSLEGDSSYIEVGVDLFERDPISNDLFGLVSEGSYRRWSLSEDPTDSQRTDRNGEAQFQIEMTEDGSVVRLSFDVTPLDS